MASSTIENKNGLLPILIGAWTAFLLIAFFSYRGSDVGSVGQLVGNLGGGPLFEFEGFRDSSVGCLVAGIVVISWFGLGGFLTTLISTKHALAHSHVLELVLSTAVGAAAWSLTWFFLGLLGLYNVWSAVGAAVIGIALAVLRIQRLREIRRSEEHTS